MPNSAHRPTCLLFHNVINRLSVILGNYELLHEQMLAGPLDSHSLGRLEAIQTAAKNLLDDMKRHKCKLDALERSHLITEPFDQKKPAPAVAPSLVKTGGPREKVVG